MIWLLGVILLPDLRLRQISFYLFLVYLFSLVYSLALQLALRLVPVEAPNRFWPGEWVRVRWFLRNGFLLPAPAILMSDSVGGMEVVGRLSWNLSLGAFRTAAVEYRFRPRNRGRHLHGPLVLQSSDPLGLFPFQKQLTPQRNIIVYPTVRPQMPLLPRPGVNGGLRSFNPIFQDNERVRGYRDYEQGDDLRQVDPFQSARFHKVIVRLTESTQRRRLWVYLETRPQSYPFKGRSVYWEAGINIAAALLYRNWVQGQAGGLVSTDIGEGRALAMPPSPNVPVFMELFDELAVLPDCTRTVSPELALDLLARQSRQGDVVAWVGPPPAESIEHFLETLPRKRVAVVRLVLATERVPYHPEPEWTVHFMEGLE